MTKYQYVIEFEVDDDVTPSSLGELCAAAFVQIEDSENYTTTNVKSWLLQEKNRWEIVW
jgi:hypothetical protein